MVCMFSEKRRARQLPCQFAGHLGLGHGISGLSHCKLGMYSSVPGKKRAVLGWYAVDVDVHLAGPKPLPMDLELFRARTACCWRRL